MQDGDSAAPQPLAGVRVAVGVAQGLALYLLYSAFDAKVWPATGAIFAPLVLLALFLPPISIVGAGNVRTRTLTIWVAAAATVILALAWYDIWRDWPVNYVWAGPAKGPRAEPPLLPSFAFTAFLAAGLFIADALIAGGDADRKFMASYPTHFDVAWKLAVQLALAAVFVAAFWLILWLGAGLFQLIKLNFFERLIEHRWFAIPASALAAAAALHVSDVRAGLVRGIRTLALVLFSWLLPLMALIAAGFLAGLIFTGLAPLWATRHAGALLLIAAAVLVVLINAAYQDGHAERQALPFFRYAIRFASFLLLPLVALAAYAIALRVDQYGWTVDRIASAACVVVAASYAIGYIANAFAPERRLLETWNFATALLILAVLFALFTPIADPARISVASQLARLQSGRVKPEAFDYNFLRWEAGRYGRDALLKLAAASSPRAIRVQAQAALSSITRYSSPTVPTAPVNLATRLIVHPAGRDVPESFVRTKWSDDPSSSQQPACLNSSNFKCDLFFADLNGDGHDEILLLLSDRTLADRLTSNNEIVIYRQSAAGWRIAGTLSLPYKCAGPYRRALLSGNFKLLPPAWQMKDFEILGARFVPNTGLMLFAQQPTCPKN
ncbi:MAG TPA: DUF4153 domain-containing protein [Rhizomicrobium sp.]|jgi:hypothetical protein|nr:DUF4153 domain-containing protein [Rhizomicrobium sp.]